MKLYGSTRSPAARKVLIVACELGCRDEIQLVPTFVSRNRINEDLQRHNPLVQLPTLLLDDGSALYDSAVICEYLNSLHPRQPLLPRAGASRWSALRAQALGDKVLDLTLLYRVELRRAPRAQSSAVTKTLREGLAAVLDECEREAAWLGTGPYGIGHITIGTALSYLDFRCADLQWRDTRPGLAGWLPAFLERASSQATQFIEEG